MAVHTEVTYHLYLAKSTTKMLQVLRVFEHETSISGMPGESRTRTLLRQYKRMSFFGPAGHCTADSIFSDETHQPYSDHSWLRAFYF